MTDHQPTVDLGGELDPLFGRYRLALGRTWKWIALASVIVAALAAFLLGQETRRANARISLDSTAAGLLEPVELNRTLARIPDLSELQDVVAAYDEPDDVSIVTALGDSLVVSVSAPSADEATTVLEDLVTQIDTRARGRRQAYVNSLRSTIESDQVLLQQRLADIDADLAEAGTEAVRDSVISDRQRVSDGLTLTERRLAALGLYEQERQETVVSYDPLARSSTTVLWFVAGLLLTAMALIALTVVLAHGDRRVWSRRDAAALGLAPVLPLLPIAGTERAVAAASIARASTVGGMTPLLVPVGGAESIAGELEAVIDGSRAVAMSELHEQLDGDGRNVLLVATTGRTRVDDLTRAAEYVRTLGGEVAGIVIGGVTERELRRADA